VPGAVCPVRTFSGVEALAEVVTTSTLTVEPDVPGAYGKIFLFIVSQASDQFPDEIREQLTYEWPFRHAHAHSLPPHTQHQKDPEGLSSLRTDGNGLEQA
jgi:hypothetical protein